MAVTIRPVTPADLGALAAVHACSFSPAWSEPELRWMLDPPGLGLVAAGADRLAGFVLARAIADEAEILTLAVAPEFRRIGVGSRLLHALIEDFGVRAVAAVHLEVAADNIAALQLYARAGFAEAGRRRDYYARTGAPAIDAVVMMKRLGVTPQVD